MSHFARAQSFLAYFLLSAAAMGGTPHVPNQFRIEERAMSYPTSFRLKTSSGDFGIVSKRFLSASDTYDWKDPAGRLVAVGKRAMFSWGGLVEVYDEKGSKVGTVKEQVAQNLLSIDTTYSISDANGNKLAESIKYEWLTVTDIKLQDAKGGVIIQIKRPATVMGDVWDVNIYQHSQVDPRLVVMIAVFKTDSDND